MSFLEFVRLTIESDSPSFRNDDALIFPKESVNSTDKCIQERFLNLIVAGDDGEKKDVIFVQYHFWQSTTYIFNAFLRADVIVHYFTYAFIVR